MARKYIDVSLGACLGPMPGMGTNYNRTAVLARPQTFRISVFKSPEIQNSLESHQRWHSVMIFRRVLDLQELKIPSFSIFSAEPRRPDV